MCPSRLGLGSLNPEQHFGPTGPVAAEKRFSSWCLRLEARLDGFEDDREFGLQPRLLPVVRVRYERLYLANVLRRWMKESDDE